MSRSDFFTEGSKKIEKHFQQISNSGKSFSKIFDDFLTILICALSNGEFEDQYFQTIKDYSKDDLDNFSKAFADLILAMENEKRDILGDFFEGGITHGENGQFFTPENVSDMMAVMGGDSGFTICDPTCGSGRMLLSAGKLNPKRFFIGKDIDIRCVKMTTLNLALNGLSGVVQHGNGLTFENWLVYEVGFNGKGFIREIKDFKTEKEEPEKKLEEIIEKKIEIKKVDFLQNKLF